MSLETILSHIQNTAKIEADKIARQAKEETGKILQEARLQADKLYQELLANESSLYEKEKQKLIVQARLEGRKNLLAAKQELISDTFKKLKSGISRTKLKKQQIVQDKIHEVSEDPDYYLDRVRPDYEADIAKILFS